MNIFKGYRLSRFVVSKPSNRQSFAFLSPWHYVVNHPLIFVVLILLTLLDSLLMSAGVIFFQELVAEINSVATYLVLFAAFRLVYFSLKDFAVEHYKIGYKRFLKDELSAYSIRKSAKISDVQRIVSSIRVYLAVPAIVVPSVVYAVILAYREPHAFALSTLLFTACFFIFRWHKKNVFRSLRKLRSSRNKYVDFVSGSAANSMKERQKIAVWYSRDLGFLKLNNLQGAAVSFTALLLTSIPYLHYANSPGTAILFHMLLLSKVPAYFNLFGIQKESEVALNKMRADLTACGGARAN